MTEQKPLAGSLLAVAIATGVPGLVPILSGLGQRDPQLRALMAEAAMAVAMALFGALVLRSKALGVLLLVAYFVLVFVIGETFTFASAQRTTEGGPVLVIGTLISLGAALMHVLLALFAWWAISSATKKQSFAMWLLVLGGAQLVLKGFSGGSVLFGGLAAAYAAVLMKPKLALPAVVAALCLLTEAWSWLGVAQQASLDQLPQCADALGARARTVPGVTEAASEGATVYVLSLDGGVLPAVEKAVAGTECVAFTGTKLERATKFEVKPASPVETDVTATWHPGVNRPEGEEPKIEAAVRRWFETPRLHVADRTDYSDPVTPDVDGWVEYRVGQKVLRDYWFESKPGAVLVLRKLEVVKAMGP